MQNSLPQSTQKTLQAMKFNSNSDLRLFRLKSDKFWHTFEIIPKFKGNTSQNSLHEVSEQV